MLRVARALSKSTAIFAKIPPPSNRITGLAQDHYDTISRLVNRAGARPGDSRVGGSLRVAHRKLGVGCLPLHRRRPSPAPERRSALRMGIGGARRAGRV